MRNIRIRAVTVGMSFADLNTQNSSKFLADFYQKTDAEFKKNQIAIQTQRLTLPISYVEKLMDCYQINSMIGAVHKIADQVGIRWLCLPVSGDRPMSKECLHAISQLFIKFPKLFMHFVIAKEQQIYTNFIASAVETLISISKHSNNGFDNFRLGIGANIKANTPYFPFSYHMGAAPGFSLAVDCLEEVINIVKINQNEAINCIQAKIIAGLLPIVQEINSIGLEIAKNTGLIYFGQDISFAPFPGLSRSVGGLIELLMSNVFGQSGSLLATSVLTDTLKTILARSKVVSTGFNGVMFSLLEDSQLARTNNQKCVNIDKLLLYSSVCGCGVDMVPISGDTVAETICGLALDVAALSTVLNKPLGVRLLPIPMRSANQFTDFNHDFITNTRILDIDNLCLGILSKISTDPFFEYSLLKKAELQKELNL